MRLVLDGVVLRALHTDIEPVHPVMDEVPGGRLAKLENPFDGLAPPPAGTSSHIVRLGFRLGFRLSSGLFRLLARVALVALTCADTRGEPA